MAADPASSSTRLSLSLPPSLPPIPAPAHTHPSPPSIPLSPLGERELKAKKEAAIVKAARAGKPPPPTRTATRPRARPRAIRVRKGVRIRGIKVVDAETKRAAKEALAAAAAAEKLMEVEAGGPTTKTAGDAEWRDATPV